MLNFNFLEKSMGIVSPPHFVYDISRKMVFMLYSINWTNFNVKIAVTSWDIAQYMVAIVCYSSVTS